MCIFCNCSIFSPCFTLHFSQCSPHCSDFFLQSSEENVTKVWFGHCKALRSQTFKMCIICNSYILSPCSGCAHPGSVGLISSRVFLYDSFSKFLSSRFFLQNYLFKILSSRFFLQYYLSKIFSQRFFLIDSFSKIVAQLVWDPVGDLGLTVGCGLVGEDFAWARAGLGTWAGLIGPQVGLEGSQVGLVGP